MSDGKVIVVPNAAGGTTSVPVDPSAPGTPPVMAKPKTFFDVLGEKLKQLAPFMGGVGGGQPGGGVLSPGQVGGAPPQMVNPLQQAMTPVPTMPQFQQTRPALAPAITSPAYASGFEFGTKQGRTGANVTGMIQGAAQFINDVRRRKEEKAAKEAQNLMMLLMAAQQNPTDPHNKAIIESITGDPKKMKILEKGFGEVMDLSKQAPPAMSPEAKGVQQAIGQVKSQGSQTSQKMLPAVVPQSPLVPGIQAGLGEAFKAMGQWGVRDAVDEAKDQRDIATLVASGWDPKEASRIILGKTWSDRRLALKPVKGLLNGKPASAFADQETGRYFQTDAQGNRIYFPADAFVPLPPSASSSRFQQFIDAKAAVKKNKTGEELTPEERLAAQAEFSILNRPNLSYVEAESAARARGRITAEASELTPTGQKSLVEIENGYKMMDELAKRFETMTDDSGQPLIQNNTPLYFAKERAKYAIGMAPDDDMSLLASDIAQLELGKIIGAMPYATKSRNYKYIEDIYKHLPNVWYDSPKQLYEKLTTSRGNFDRLSGLIGQYEVKHATAEGPKGNKSNNKPGNDSSKRSITLSDGTKVTY